MGDKRVDHIAVAVADLEKPLRFYTEHLGLELLEIETE
ncbi:MAG TPA: VOC family protein, partial [Candidatus Melainabacteria bacterium]|nr:VOC family protein [Candidatus Melainabacteria bacterium]